MKRSERLAVIEKKLLDSPNKIYSLKGFCKEFNAAKSTISEDISILKNVFNKYQLGIIETSRGSQGGVKLIPYIKDEDVVKLQNQLIERLKDPARLLGGGFIYTSDLMFDSHLVGRIATVFTRKFQDKGATMVATLETKGIPLAVMTAYLMNLPLVVIRREAKISEGSTVSINYFSGSYDRIQKMSISKRSVTPGSKAIVIDDFMRGGGSVKGIEEILGEFEIEVLSSGIVIVSQDPEKKVVKNYVPLIIMKQDSNDRQKYSFFPNSLIFSTK